MDIDKQIRRGKAVRELKTMLEDPEDRCELTTAWKRMRNTGKPGSFLRQAA